MTGWKSRYSKKQGKDGIETVIALYCLSEFSSSTIVEVN